MKRYFRRFGTPRKANPLNRSNPYPPRVRWLLQQKLEQLLSKAERRHMAYSLKAERHENPSCPCRWCRNDAHTRHVERRRLPARTLAQQRADERRIPFR